MDIWPFRSFESGLQLWCALTSRGLSASAGLLKGVRHNEEDTSQKYVFCDCGVLIVSAEKDFI